LRCADLELAQKIKLSRYIILKTTTCIRLEVANRHFMILSQRDLFSHGLHRLDRDEAILASSQYQRRALNPVSFKSRVVEGYL